MSQNNIQIYAYYEARLVEKIFARWGKEIQVIKFQFSLKGIHTCNGNVIYKSLFALPGGISCKIQLAFNIAMCLN
jgi:hypothetical protein